MQERLDSDLKTALKQGQKLRLGVLRMLRAELKNMEIAKGDPLEEPEILEALSRYARKRKDVSSEFERGGRQDLAEKELAEYEIVMGYLPRALSEDELASVVNEVISGLGASGIKQMGAVMKEVLQRVAGRADGAAVSALVKARLSG